MQLRLYEFRGRGRRLTSPSMNELLEDHAPFLITQPGRRGHDTLVYGEWQTDWHPTEIILKGVIVVDHARDCHYYARKPSREFQQRNGTIHWHADKFHVYANKYELVGIPEEVNEEFRKLRFTFP